MERASSLCELGDCDVKLTSREGIMALQDVKMRDLFDLKVFVVRTQPSCSSV